MSDEQSPRFNVTHNLQNSQYSALRSVTCEFQNGRATLQGSVPSYYLKQIAQKLAASAQGVTQVDNRLQVLGRRDERITNRN